MANENGCRVSELRSCLSTVSELICSAPQLIKHSCIFDHCLAHGTGHGFKSKGNWFLLSWCYFYRKLFSPEALKEKHSPQFIPSWRHLQSSSEVGAEWSPLLKKKKKKRIHCQTYKQVVSEGGKFWGFAWRDSASFYKMTTHFQYPNQDTL